MARKFLKAILAHGHVAPLLSDEHFTVDGTLVQAWASMKSFVPKEPPDADVSPPDGNGDDAGGTDGEKVPESVPESKPEAPTEPTRCMDTGPMQGGADDNKSRNAEVDFHGRKRSNATHASTTDPEARLYKKGKGAAAKLCFIGHATTENRHGLVVETEMTQATGTAEREAAKAMIESHAPGSERQLTVGADKAYDTADFVADMRRMCVTPHVAQNDKGRASAIDARTTRHTGYAVSQKKRKLIEEAFGWGKVIGGLARPMRRGRARMGFAFTFTMAAYDLIRLPRLLAEAAA